MEPPDTAPSGARTLEELKRDVLRRRVEHYLAKKKGLRNHTPGTVSIPCADRSRPLPLTPAQRRLWFLTELDPGLAAAHTITAAVRIRGPLAEEALRAALDTIVERHEILRTRFAVQDDRPVQMICPGPVQVPLTHDPLERSPQGDREQAARESALAFSALPFHLDRGPLIRAHLIRLAEDDRVLVLALHHIASDAWSLGILQTELQTLYAAFERGGENPLPPPALQYGDYAAWLAAQSSLETDHWRSHLAGAPALIGLPTRAPRVPNRGYGAGTTPVVLSATTSAGLRTLAASSGSTLFAVLLLCWCLLLERLGAGSDIVIGVAAANRRRRELADVIGFFVDTLPLRVRVEPDDTIGRALDHVRTTLLAGLAHSETPFEAIVEAVGARGTVGHNPVFQVMLNFDSTPDAAASDGAVAFEPFALPRTATALDLTLSLADRDGCIQGEIEYAGELFDRDTIERWTSHLGTLAESLVTAAHDVRVGDLAVLTAAECDRLDGGLGSSPLRPSPPGEPVHRRFEARAAEMPDAIALTAGDDRLSYGELNVWADSIAHRLVEMGIERNGHVALYGARGFGLIAGLLGILKSGCAYVPLDTTHPDWRLASMLASCAPKAVLGDAVLLDRLIPLVEGGTVLVALDQAPFGSSTAPTSTSQVGPGDGCLAYVLYTSGSSGDPKGVMVEHRQLTSYVDWAIAEYAGGQATSSPLNTPLSFDAAVTSLFVPLCTGGTVSLLPEGRAELPALADALGASGGDLVKLTPAQLAGLFALNPGLAASSTPRIFVIGGEALTAAHVAPWRNNPAIRLINEYGPTETTVGCANYEISPETQCEGDVPIGRSISGARLYLLNERGHPVPTGVAGEIYIGGAGVARGYVGAPELTAQRFVANPFLDGDRLYRSGDFARCDAAGVLHYLGRRDEQVKLRGYRIELGEVAAAVAAAPGIGEATAILRDLGDGDRRIIAYYVATAADASGTTAAAAAAAAERLPFYAVPSHIIALDAWPLTPNGKIDRAALPAPLVAAAISPPSLPPATPLEIEVAAIWARLLKVDGIGQEDDFFELGGHSMLAIPVIAEMRRRGRRADLRQLLGHPRLGAFCAAIELQAANDAPSPLPPLPAPDPALLAALGRALPGGVADIQDVYPLAPLQQGLLFHHAMAPERDVYVSVHVVAFDNEPLLRRFLTALDRVVARHDSLRTAFHWEGFETPVQVVHRTARVAVTELNLPLGSTVDEFAAAARASLGGGMPLDRAPLLRVCIAGDDFTTTWRLALLAHHIVVDHVSLRIVIDEVEAFLAGRGDTLPQAPQYRDHIARNLLGSREAQQAYFVELLSDVEAPTAAFGTTSLVSGSDGVVTMRSLLPETVARALRAAARERRTTPAILFHAAFAYVVARCSGSDDVVFGTALSGRLYGDGIYEGMVGLVLNTLPLRVDTAAAPVDVVATVTAQLQALLDHEQTPLSLAQSASGVPAQSPLFTSFINYRHAVTTTDPDAADQVWAGIRLVGAEEHSTYPLSLSVDDDGEGFGLVLHTTDGVPAARVLGYIQTALDAIVDALTDEVTNDIDVMPAAEQRDLLAAATPSPAWRQADALPVHKLFERQAEAQPDAIAISHRDNRLSYGALDARASGLARSLAALGLAPDDRIAICAERGTELVTGMIAILKSGAAYVPLDPEWPDTRIAQVLTDCAPKAVLAGPGMADRLPSLAQIEVPLLNIDARQWPTDASAEPVGIKVAPDQLAYVIYTSGSTGAPKGVMVEHRNVVHLAMNDALPPMTAASVTAFASNPAFDAATWEVWATLLAGGRLAIVTSEDLLDAARFGNVLRAEGVTCLWLTVGLLALHHRALADALAQLDCLIFGGDSADPAVVAHIIESGAPVHLVNGYGPTETTTFATTYKVEAVAPDQARIPVGRPLGGVHIRILDARDRPVPAGVPGEIVIGGAGVSRGYLGRPDLTAERFLPDPAVKGGRLYRSGDIGRLAPDGAIDLIGRDDRQVKIRGYRIEPAEVEAALRKLASVQEAAVVARPTSDDSAALVAYIIPTGGARVDASALRAGLTNLVPSHMVPVAFVPIQRWPLTPNGKLDRGALPAPADIDFARRGGEPPEGPKEIALGALWEELLGTPVTGRDDHFFELGGHSLTAIRLAGATRERLGADLTLVDIFEHSTLAAMAARMADPTATALPPIISGKHHDTIPLSWTQRRLWFLDRLDPRASSAYHVSAGVRLQGSLDYDALQRALDTLTVRHEALRTRFASRYGVPEQIVDPATPFRLDVTDFAAPDLPAAETALEELISAEVAAPFDLSIGHLIRGRLIRMAPDDHVLLIVQHHIVSDGWSIGVLIDELCRLYAAFVANEPDPLRPGLIQYADYALWQRDTLGDDCLDRQAAFWRDHLAGAPALLELPADRPRPLAQRYRGGRSPVRLDPDLTASLRALARRNGATLFMVLLASWASLLARLANQDQVVVGTAVANRQRPELADVVGFFANTIALRIPTRHEDTVRSLLCRVRETTLAGFEHQDVPFDRVVEDLHPDRSLGHNPLFQTMFALANAPTGRDALPGITLSGIELPDTTAAFDLSLTIGETGDELIGHIGYASDLFDHATIVRWTSHFETLLHGIAADDEAVVASLPLVAGDDAVLWSEGNLAVAPSEALIHRLFEAQVAARPAAAAVTAADETWSYAALNTHANRIAHRLLALGVKPDDRVAVCADRGIALVAALIGVLKAGGAYVPIDPAAPPARIGRILADAAPRAVLAQSGCAPRLPAQETMLAPLLLLDDPTTWADAPDGDPLVPNISPDSLAYVIYTSGSSGEPKGVMVEHSSVVHLATDASLPPIGPGGTTAFASNPAFDAATWEIWATLLSGGRLVAVAQDDLLDAARFGALLDREYITHCWMTVGLLAQHYRALASQFGALDCLIFGGDQCDPQIIAHLIGHGPPRHLVNGYGPTETTTFATCHHVDAVAADQVRIPIGRPLTGAVVRILDPGGHRSPIGVIGEIHIGGTGLARGYLGRPDLTAERFIDDPFSPGDRLYRTGDLGRFQPDGKIEYLGRNDDQAKVRGFRVEPGEIEAALRSVPGVAESLVLVRPASDGNKRLLAYWRADGSGDTDAAHLRAALAARLPDYMIPAAFVPIAEWPLTPNGKLDRASLPEPNVGDVVRRGWEEPEAGAEQAIAAIWRDLFGLERVGRQDHFFELGGHSLLAVQLIERLQTVGLSADLRALFAAPTLASFASATRPASPEVLRRSRHAPPGEHPASAKQVADWINHRVSLVRGYCPYGSSASSDSTRSRLRCSAARSRLLIDKHEILRTTLHLVGDALIQRVHAARQLPAITCHDLSAHFNPAAEAARIADVETQRSIDFAQLPLFHVTHMRLRSEDLVILTIEHFCADQTFLDCFCIELADVYAQLIASGDATIAPTPADYAQYARWEQEELSGHQRRRHLDYWSAKLRHAGIRQYCDHFADSDMSPETSHRRLIARQLHQLGIDTPFIVRAASRYVAQDRG